MFLFDVRNTTKNQIVNSVDRRGCFESKIDMNGLDPTKVLASSPQGVHVYDIRNLNKRIFSMDFGLGTPTQCKWSPHRDFVFGTSFTERQVAITDMGEIDRYSLNDSEDIEKSMIVRIDNDLVQPRRTQEGNTELRLE